MIITLIFISILVILFMKTAVKTNSREMQNSSWNESLNVEFSTNYTSMFLNNPYIHSIWDMKHRIIYEENIQKQIPNDIVINAKGVNTLQGTWLDPIHYENKMLIPFAKKQDDNIIIAMFPFYI